MPHMEFLAALIAVVSPVADESPLAKSDDGFVQCYEPNDVTKTCLSIASYKRRGDGTLYNIAIVLIDPAHSVSLETVTPVSVKNGAVCGYVRAEDILKGTLRVSGRAIPDEKAGSALAQVSAAMAAIMNKEICTSYVQGQGALIAKATIEGSIAPLPDQRVRWILPSDGYTVGSASPVMGAGSSQ